MYKLYSIQGSCSTAIHILMRKLNLPVDIIMRADTDNYASLVPTNQVPALVAGDKTYTEGASIALYLLEKHASLPSNMDDRVEFRQWLMFVYATLHPAYGKLFAVAAAMESGDQRDALLAKFADRISELWAIVDRHLAQREYVVGREVSLVDYLVAVYSRWGNNFPELTISLGKHVEDLIDRVLVLPECVSAFERESIKTETVG